MAVELAVQDDQPILRNLTTREDTAISFNSSADATPNGLIFWQDSTTPLTYDPLISGVKTAHGILRVSADGLVTYRPDANFSGTEVFTYASNEEGVNPADNQKTVTVTVTPVADAPNLGRTFNGRISVLEDDAAGVLLGFDVPRVTDVAGTAGNNTISEKLGLISLTGVPVGATLFWDGGPVGGYEVTSTDALLFELSDGDMVRTAGQMPDHILTSQAWTSLKVAPPAQSGDDFYVSVQVRSYEVDGTGAILTNVPPARTTISVPVQVEAVTDKVSLTPIDTLPLDVTPSGGEDNLVVSGLKVNEDRAENLALYLKAAFEDLDGSETRQITVTNNSGQPITVNGTQVVDGFSSTPITVTGSTLPVINVLGPKDYAGDLNNITVTLTGKDTDTDLTSPQNAAQPVTSSSSVTFNLKVRPDAVDVGLSSSEVRGVEDTPFALLAGVMHKEPATAIAPEAQERITAVSFRLPEGWSLTGSASILTADVINGIVTIRVHDLNASRAQIEAAFDSVMVTAPAHSSLDHTFTLTLTARQTVDGETVIGNLTNVTLKAIIEPKAEEVGGTTLGVDDASIVADHDYTTAGAEDQWFTLGQEGVWTLQPEEGADWSSSDADEKVFASLTIELVTGDLNGSAAELAAGAKGSKLSWMDGGDLVIREFTGDPIEVPVDALNSLQFMAPKDKAGVFQIKGQLKTYDMDDDTEDDGNWALDALGVVTALSGSMTLGNIVIKPAADFVSLEGDWAVDAFEEVPVALRVQPLSSDASEVFDVTIANLPDGAILTYDGQVLSATGGAVTITAFDATKSLTFTSPVDFNGNVNTGPDGNPEVVLRVSAVARDTVVLNGETITSTSPASAPQTLRIAVKGVPDMVDLTLLTSSADPSKPVTYSEKELDAGTDRVLLSDLFTVALRDSDTSEVYSLKVTNLAEGFDLKGAVLLEASDIPEHRVWTVSAKQLAGAYITVPENFNGTYTFGVIPLSTENDGASSEHPQVNVTFAVTPSPEASVIFDTEFLEDVRAPLNLRVASQNGDSDEVIHQVRIKVADLAAAPYELFVGTANITTLGTTVMLDGGTYYLLNATQAQSLSIQTKPHVSGTEIDLPLSFTIRDPGRNGLSDVVDTVWKDVSGDLQLTFAPVTDQVAMNLVVNAPTKTDGTTTLPIGTVSGQAVTLVEPGKIRLDVKATSLDTDGSEDLVRIVLRDVPNGVTVEGADYLGGTTWVLIYEGNEALPIGRNGSVTVPVVLSVSGSVGTLVGHEIEVAVYNQDGTQQDQPQTEAVQYVTLNTTFTGPGSLDPMTIDHWDFKQPGALEDKAFTLKAMIDAELSVGTPLNAVLTVTLSNVPEGATITGMVKTMEKGVAIWSASVTTLASDTSAQVTDKLNALLETITVTPPAHLNDNNAVTPFSFDATLNAALVGSTANASAAIKDPQIAVAPLVDPILFDVTSAPLYEDLDATNAAIAFSITPKAGVDGAFARLSDGILSIEIAGDQAGLTGGRLIGPNGVEIVAQNGVFTVSGAVLGQGQTFTYLPTQAVAGTLTVKVSTGNREEGATDPMVSTQTAVLEVLPANDGVQLVTGLTPSIGSEAVRSNLSNAISLGALGATLIDQDGSETIRAINLTDVPQGFLVYLAFGEGEDRIYEMAGNAGSQGTTATWNLAGGDGVLPSDVLILPPKYWSGTLEGASGLKLQVISGEIDAKSLRVDEMGLPPLTVVPVANGADLNPTLSFGTEGEPVRLNLNASLKDRGLVSNAAVADNSFETYTLRLEGLGSHASFTINGESFAPTVVAGTNGPDYVFTGLTQAQLDKLAVILPATGGEKVYTAHLSTVESYVGAGQTAGHESAVASATGTVNMLAAAEGLLVWTGGTTPLTGRPDPDSGPDTLLILGSQSLTGADLAANVSAIEVVDMTRSGTSELIDLTPEDVAAISGGQLADHPWRRR